MINAVIIDDEKNNISNLEGLLKKHCPQIEVKATATNADAGIEIILKHNPDLVFLDIQMPGKNGFEMLQDLPDHDLEVIFVTAFDNYGIQAVKFSALDYLLKPVNIKDLKAAVEKMMEKSSKKKQNLQLENLLELLQHKEQINEHRIALSTAKETRFINPAQIIRCESSNTYTHFYLADGQKIIVSRPIFEFEELLEDYGFIRSHQSHLVNKAFIKSWTKEDGDQLLLTDHSLIPISRNKKESVAKALTTLKKKSK
jgi:two-component system LytT family response regulator